VRQLTELDPSKEELICASALNVWLGWMTQMTEQLGPRNEEVSR